MEEDYLAGTPRRLALIALLCGVPLACIYIHPGWIAGACLLIAVALGRRIIREKKARHKTDTARTPEI